MSKQIVSVILPCYNAEGHIKETLDSILNQSYSDLEVIVVDDGSIDGTKEILDSYGDKIKVVRQKNSGPAIARNRALFLSSGEYVAFCDSDDLWDKEKIRKQMLIFSKEPRCGMVSANGFFINNKGIRMEQYIINPNLIKEGLVEVSLRDMLIWARLYPSATILSREAILETGLLFDSKNYFFENVFLWMRIAEKFKVFLINELLVKRRYLESSLSHKYNLKNRYAQIQVYSLALADFPNYSKEISSQLVHSLYVTARMELLRKRYSNGRRLMKAAFKIDLFFGRKYFCETDSCIQKIRKLISPFVIYLLSFIKLTLAEMKKSEW